MIPSTELTSDGSVLELGRTLAVDRLPQGAQREFLSALPTPDGSILAVDGRRPAVLLLTPDRLIEVPSPWPGGLWRSPIFAEPVGDRFLVCDRGWGGVVECDATGRVHWMYDCASAGLRGSPSGTARDSSTGVTYVAMPESDRIIGVDRCGVLVAVHVAPVGSAPTAVRLCADRSLLVTLRGAHVVRRLGTDGDVTFSFGHPGEPDSRPDSLNTPSFAVETPIGTVLITDTKNNRLVEVSTDGTVVWQHGRRECGTDPGLLRFPMSAVRSSDGTTVVADGLNGRILLLSAGRERPVFDGGSAFRASVLALPRGASFTESGEMRVTDCYNNRVLLLDRRGSPVWELDRFLGLAPDGMWWPRHWAGSPDDAVIADGRRSRVVRVDRRGRVRSVLVGYRRPDGVHEPLADPHHVQPLTDSTVLICDSGTGRVVESTWEGQAMWMYADLQDPHSAQRLPSGNTLIADTGRHRVIEVDADGATVWAFEARQAMRTTGIPLRSPRSARRLGTGATLVLDTGNDRLLQVSQDGRMEWIFQPCDCDAVGRLCAPRAVDIDCAERTVVVSDFENHRILVMPLGYQPRCPYRCNRHS